MSRTTDFSKLTPKQLEVYTAIKGFISKYSYPPSIRELCKMCDCNSPATIFVHLKKMKRKGFIDFEEKKGRTIRIMKEVDYDII